MVAGKVKSESIYRRLRNKKKLTRNQTLSMLKSTNSSTKRIYHSTIGRLEVDMTVCVILLWDLMARGKSGALISLVQAKCTQCLLVVDVHLSNWEVGMLEACFGSGLVMALRNRACAAHVVHSF